MENKKHETVEDWIQQGLNNPKAPNVIYEGLYDELVANEPADPYLYILMRNDMISLNPGKAMAQAAHASNQFVYENSEWLLDNTAFEEWSSQANGFGNTIVLGATEKQIYDVLSNFDRLYETTTAIAAAVLDPSYPISDGQVCHTLPVVTCAYVFLDKNIHQFEYSLLSKLNLHP